MPRTYFRTRGDPMAKRYVVSLSVHEIDEEGDTTGEELARHTTEWATADLNHLEEGLPIWTCLIDNSITGWTDDASERHPQKETEE